MRTNHHAARGRPSLSLVLLVAALALVWIAGGASRADVPGQAVVRGGCWLLLIAGLMAAPRPSASGVWPAWLLLGAAALLACMQLVPLPPSIWGGLPGRAFFAQGLAAAGQPLSWRPVALVPSRTFNALSSLVVPATILYLLTCLNARERTFLPGLMIGLVTAASLAALLQFAGIEFGTALVGGSEVRGPFANRNHLALFIAIGCLVCPAWAFARGRRLGWRGLIALGLVALFVLTILAIGSRAGLLVGMLGLGLGLGLAWPGLRRELGRAPRWMFWALVATIVGVVAGLAVISVLADRAASIDRLFAVDTGRDMRQRGLPVVLEMIRTYFPFGIGLGGFDPLFRSHEPFDLLKPTYFNHAHNDYLEIVLDTGLPGLLLLGAGIGWWAWASWRAWRGLAGSGAVMPALGSAVLLLILVASMFDYPARTPIIMATAAMAAFWLGTGRNVTAASWSALPAGGKHL